jgi:hypothetical protein
MIANKAAERMQLLLESMELTYVLLYISTLSYKGTEKSQCTLIIPNGPLASKIISRAIPMCLQGTICVD